MENSVNGKSTFGLYHFPVFVHLFSIVVVVAFMLSHHYLFLHLLRILYWMLMMGGGSDVTYVYETMGD